MATKSKREFLRFLARFIVEPAVKQRSALLTVLVALVLLALMQGLALILMKGFLAAFFADPGRSKIVLGDILPERLLVVLPSITTYQIPRDVLVWAIPLGILIAGVLKSSASYVYGFGIARMALKVAQNYREKVFDAALRLPWLASSSKSAGDWMTIIMSDAIFIQSRLTDFSAAFIKDGVLIVSCLITLALIHFPAAVMLAALVPIIAWQMGRAGRRISWFTEAFQRELGVLAGIILGIRERFRYMRAQHAEALEMQKFADRNHAYLGMMTSSIFIRALIAPGMEWLGFVVFAAFIFGWTRKIPGFELAPDLVLQFFVALGLILKPVRELGEQVARWSETIGGLKRSMSVVQAVESGENVQRAVSTERLKYTPIENICIDRLEIFYGERRALVGDELEIKPKSSIAIVGPSGSGKSSLLRVLSGLVPPEVWDANIPWIQIGGLSAMVSQTPFLFKDTLRNNLLYGFSEAEVKTVSDRQLWSSLAVVNMDHVVRALPMGLDTIFRPLDSNLSGGQVQRLVIARALLKNPKLLLLDEATSAIDAATEMDVTQRLIQDARTSGRMLIAVTHRLQWLSLYDEIWFVENGKVEVKGTFPRLMEGERFRAFVAAGVQP